MQMVQVNALGSLWLVNAVLPGMKAQGAGKIVLVSSVGGGVSQFPGEFLDSAKVQLENLFAGGNKHKDQISAAETVPVRYVSASETCC